MVSSETRSEPIRILLVEDQPGDAELVQELLSEDSSNRFYFSHVGALRLAAQRAREERFDVVLLDLGLPDSSGLDTVTAMRSAAPETPVVVLSGMARDELALDAVRHGAQDFLVKGQIDGPALARTLLFAIQRRRSAVDGSILDSERAPDGTDALVGPSRSMGQVRALIRKLGPTDSTVLITGETGTGKQLVAQALHEAGPRRVKPMVTLHCGAHSDEQLEAILFGQSGSKEDGSDEVRSGLVQLAGQGTLLLDEVGELSLAMQAKLLRALECKEVLPAGAARPKPLIARILASTNRDLLTMISRGLFRPDLFYRLNVLEIHIPPLRERPEDIVPTAEHFLRIHCRKAGREVSKLHPEFQRKLEDYPWPGNVRELSNRLERLVLLTQESELGPDDWPLAKEVSDGSYTDNLRDAREVFEQEHIRRVLTKWSGDKVRAAKALGIDLSSLYRKLSE